MSKVTLSFFSSLIIHETASKSTEIAHPHSDRQLVIVVTQKYHYPTHRPPPLFCLMLTCRRGMFEGFYSNLRLGNSLCICRGNSVCVHGSTRPCKKTWQWIIPDNMVLIKDSASSISIIFHPFDRFAANHDHSKGGPLVPRYTVGGGKTWSIHYIAFHWNGIVPSRSPFRFHSACTHEQLIPGRGLPMCQKFKSQLIRSLAE